jgi:ribonucleoside-diphosphate reductase beta chain
MIKVIKRSKKTDNFSPDKIVTAIIKAMKDANKVNSHFANNIAKEIQSKFQNNNQTQVDVNDIHDEVEQKLMEYQLYDVAKEYIIYRNNNKPDIFKKRTNIKPYEYPNLLEYVDAIRHSYWIHTEFNYSSDVQDIKISLNEKERTAVTRAMLAISQIESAVKTFWGDLYKKLPKPEIAKVGATFSESEVRHEDAYSHLIEILGLNKEFENLLEVPSIRRRIKYLEKTLNNTKSNENQDFFESIILFSMFIENVSLFSQFLVIMSFNKFKNTLKGISNAVEATSKEEDLHAKFGFDIVNIIKSENPQWWTEELIDDIKSQTFRAYEAEKEIVEWIFEKGDLDFLTKEQTLEFIKHRFNESLKAIGINSGFEIKKEILKQTEWFEDEVLTTKHTDFFYKRSINYSKKSKSVTEDDLF